MKRLIFTFSAFSSPKETRVPGGRPTFFDLFLRRNSMNLDITIHLPPSNIADNGISVKEVLGSRNLDRGSKLFYTVVGAV